MINYKIIECFFSSRSIIRFNEFLKKKNTLNNINKNYFILLNLLKYLFIILYDKKIFI